MSKYDLVSVGRISMDLFAQNIGVPFPQITGFNASVGGSPVNIAIGTARLGLQSATLTAVGNDPVGDFVLRYLNEHSIQTDFISRKDIGRTPLAVVGVQPPSTFPLVFYRENPPDIHLSIDDADQLPLDDIAILMLSGTALARGSCADATRYLAEKAKSQGVTVMIDLDLRPDQWKHARSYGVNLRLILPFMDAIIGTEEEWYATLAPNPEPIMQKEPITDVMLKELDTLIRNAPFSAKRIVKRGAHGVTLIQVNEEDLTVPTFKVSVLNTVGAGDAFASGYVYGARQGWDDEACLRFANACGALVVTRHGCADAMPTVDEVMALMNQ